MGMVVQHNISAMNANEAMRKNVAGLKKQTEKLSTGYNINRAADNAAGLAISEKMRSQIRGLTQASANSNDAISLIQTAEGGLQETEDILQRMRELSVQSANGTYTDEDRQQIQYEVDALKEEVDRISQATEYNEMKLLDGSLAGKGPTNGEYGAKYGVINDGVMADEIDAIAASTDAGTVKTAIVALNDAVSGSYTAQDSSEMIAKALGFTIEDGDLDDDGKFTSTAQSKISEALAGMTADTVKDISNVLKNAGYEVTRLDGGKKLVLITGHRRENFGDGFISMVTAMKDLSEKYPDVDFVYPMHLNPNVRKPIHEVFGDDLTAYKNFFFIEPLQYLEFVYLMEKSTVVLTDSGGIQEEAPGLGKPVLVMRDTTERPEALKSGTVHLVGTNHDLIVSEVSTLLDDPAAYERMSKAVNPYGDGKACNRIVRALNGEQVDRYEVK